MPGIFLTIKLKTETKNFAFCKIKITDKQRTIVLKGKKYDMTEIKYATSDKPLTNESGNVIVGIKLIRLSTIPNKNFNNNSIITL